MYDPEVDPPTVRKETKPHQRPAPDPKTVVFLGRTMVNHQVKH